MVSPWGAGRALVIGYRGLQSIGRWREQMREHSATLRDVAAEAGVSLATASRVVSGNYPTSSDVRRRVNSAIRELAYEPRPRSPQRPRATRTIAVVVPDIRPPLVSEIAAGIEAGTSESGRLAAILTTHGDAEREREAVRTMATHGETDSVILVGGLTPPPDYAERLRQYASMLEPIDARLILCARGATPGDVPALEVGYDNEGGSFAITSYLISRGHRRIAWIGGVGGRTSIDDRLAGVRRALDAHGLELASLALRQELRRIGRFPGLRDTFVTDATDALLRDHPDVTAVLSDNDFTAVEVTGRIQDAGLDVPGDISVVGYDDNAIAATSRPGLTTVHLPHFEIGWEAVRMAVQKPSPGSPAATIELGTHIVVRGSVRDVG